MEIIKYKKEKNNIYTINFDTGLSVKLYDDVIIKYNLLINKKITDKQLEEITHYNDSLVAYYQSIKYINIKLRSEIEIENYLAKKFFNKEIITSTINHLKKDGYLNHEIYLRSYINDAINFTNDGPLKIKSNLLKLGFTEEEIMEHLNYNFTDRVLKLINKKVKANHKLSKNNLKINITNYLLNLGYSKIDFNDYINDIKVDNSEMIKKDCLLLINKYSKKYEKEKLRYFIKDKLYKKGYTIDEIGGVVDELLS